MAKTFEFLFDFGGPNSYLAHKVLPEICAQTGAEAIYVPILLGGLFKLTNNQAPLIRYAETPAKRNYEMLEFDRFVKAHRLPFKMSPHFPINSLYLMRGAVALIKRSPSLVHKRLPLTGSRRMLSGSATFTSGTLGNTLPSGCLSVTVDRNWTALKVVSLNVSAAV